MINVIEDTTKRLDNVKIDVKLTKKEVKMLKDKTIKKQDKTVLK